MKVLHCPDLVGGNAVQLSRAERRLGIDSRLIVFYQSPYNYPADEVLLSSSSGIFRREVMRWKMLWRALRYDVIHYNFGQSIMPSRLAAYGSLAQQYPAWIRYVYRYYVTLFELFDVRLLKWLGKAVIVSFQGDDARQGDYCRNHFAITFANEVEPDYYTAISDQVKRERIEVFSAYADRIYALNPDLLRVLPDRAEFLPYSCVDVLDWKPVSSPVGARPVLLHAPSHRGVKGTRYILQAVERLAEEGIEFEFILVEGMTNREARTCYEKADLLVDQLLAGWYGGLAVELMALGKPVIAYLREEDLDFIPDEMRRDLPVIQASPDSIYEVIRYFLTEGREELALLGVKSRAFVEKWHDPLTVAQRVMQEYQNVLKQHGREL